MNTTALGAATEKDAKIIFISEAHEKFYYEKLKEVRYQDVYHKALCYCLGISDDTRRNIKSIYDFKTGNVKTKCLHEGWQTSGSVRVVRMAFNLYSIEGILLTMVDSRTNYAKGICTLLKENYGSKVRIFVNSIPMSVRAAEISAEGVSIYQHDPEGKAAFAYRALTEEVLSDEYSMTDAERNKVKLITEQLEQGLKELSEIHNGMTEWSRAEELEGLRNSLDTIRKSSSELIAKIEGQITIAEEEQDFSAMKRAELYITE